MIALASAAAAAAAASSASASSASASSASSAGFLNNFPRYSESTTVHYEITSLELACKKGGTDKVG
ncbi:hypothetical protein EAF00_010518 [Botryotinia globosa]|nr:hypothetical protein EAF00_010518 [Botryotinia globosa]